MQITSLTFAGFVAAVAVVFHTLPARAQKPWLLLASYVFLASWAWQFPCVLLLLTLLNLAFGRWITTSSRRTILLAVAVTANVLALLVFRYTPPRGLPPMVGLAFVVPQAISYLADLHSGALRRPVAPADFALYLAYFPKLLAGPIERARGFVPQLSAARVVDDAALARSTTLIVVGVFRKMVLADPLAALIPARVFVAPGEFDALTLATSIGSYAFVLYNDFAGYTSIVRGVSGLFGIELMRNFAQPFFARSFTEFWNRWHVSLSAWVRDYVYLPISRALLRRDPRVTNVPNLVVPPVVAMLVSGFWHGAGSVIWPGNVAGMLVWGTLHASYLVVERLAALGRRSVPVERRARWRQVAGMAAVFVLGTVALIPFRMPPSVALAFCRQLLGGAGAAVADARVLLLIGPSLLLDALQARGGELVFLAWPRPARAALLALALLATFVASRGAPAPFVYQGY